MTVDQLHDAIGMLPSDLLAEADQRRTQKPKPFPLRRYAALAASVAVLLCGAWIYYSLAGMGAGKAAPAGNTARTGGAAMGSPLEETCAVRGDSGPDSAPETAADIMQSQAVSGSLANIPALELRWGSTVAVLSPSQYHWGEDAGAPSSDSTRAENQTAVPDSLYTISLEEGTLLLYWQTPPEELTVWCRSDQVPEPIQPELHDGALTLPSGDWLCQITARWDQGTAEYTFRVICP